MNESNLGSSIGSRGLSAPGGAITSLGATGKPLTLGGGTSVATPFVTGAIALLWSAFPTATAAQVNSSGVTIAAETIFPVGITAGTPATVNIGNNTKIKAPSYTDQYDGGVNANPSSRQKFQVAANLVGGAQWARDTSRIGDQLLTFFQTDGRQAATISAQATVNGIRGGVAVLNNADPAIGFYAIRLYSIEAGDTIQGSPLASSALTAVTYVFEVVNNTGAPLNLAQLALTFSSYKPAGSPVLANSSPDTVANPGPTLL